MECGEKQMRDNQINLLEAVKSSNSYYYESLFECIDETSFDKVIGRNLSYFTKKFLPYIESERLYNESFCTIVNAQLHGPFVFKSNFLLEKGEYFKGLIHGTKESYYQDSGKKQISNYEYGKLVGYSQSFDKVDVLTERIFYIANSNSRILEVFKDDKLVSITNLSNDRLKSNGHFYETGKLKIKTTYFVENDFIREEYNETGDIIKRNRFKSNLLDGIQETFVYFKGKLDKVYETLYKEGKFYYVDNSQRYVSVKKS